MVAPTKLAVGPGLGGMTNAVPGATVAYTAGVRIKPRYPWLPPPKEEGKEAALALRRSRRFLSESYVGCPEIGGIWFGKPLVISSMVGTAMVVMVHWENEECLFGDSLLY